MQFWLCLIDIHFFYCSRHTEWLPPTFHQVTNLRLVCSKFCSFKVLGKLYSLLNWTPAFAHLRTHLLKFSVFFFNICVPFPFQNKENWKCLLTSTNVSALCLYFEEVCAILQALHTRALLSRSIGKVKFDSEAGLLRFCGDREHIRQDQRAK